MKKIVEEKFEHADKDHNVILHYKRNLKMIQVSYLDESLLCSMTIYKNGKFDCIYKIKTNSHFKKIIDKRGILNSIAEEYNYNSIKNYIEDKRNRSSKFLYLFGMTVNLTKIAVEKGKYE